MINWKALEKFIAPGKVVTLVIMIDGKEIGALSFNVDSLAYKEILEAVNHSAPVAVAEKKPELAKSNKKAEPAKKIETVESVIQVDDEFCERLVNDEYDDDVDEVAELDKIFIADKPMTREQIMAQDSKEPTNEQREQYEKEKQPDFSPQRGSVSAGPVKEPEPKKEPEKPAQQQMQLTDEW